MAGMTKSVSTVEDTIPPTIGTAMRCMSSAPVPVLQRMGTRPAMMAATVIIFGRTRSTAPSMMARLVRVIVSMFFTEPTDDTPHVMAPGVLSKAAIAVCALVTVLLGIFPQPVLDLAERAATFLN